MKYWLDSSTIRSTILGAVPAIYAVAKVFGLDLPDGIIEQIADGVAAVAMLVSIIGAFIGRLKADKPITFKK